jgi:hypothetical protein
MPDSSTRLGLPFIQGGQAQKHVTHNEAIERLDLLVQLVVQAFGALTPPASPQQGQVWALGAAPTGAWAGQGGRLAAWSNGGWLFVEPGIGWQAVQGSTPRYWTGSAWASGLAEDLADLPGVGVGTGWDTVTRLAVASTATLFTHAGAGHQMKLNKATAGDTASILFQTGFGGRAEVGTAGSDALSFKVSPDGSAWATGLSIAPATGQVTIPNGLALTGALSLPDGSVARPALANGPAFSVIGRSANSEGAVANIAAASDHQVLRRSGSTLGFGAIALNQSGAVTGQLGVANGGTGANSAANARTNLGVVPTASATDATAGRLLKVADSATLLSASPALRMALGGSANAITLTSGAGIAGTPPTGLTLRFRATAANTGPTTLALDGGAAIACRTVTGVALPAGYVRTDADTLASFDGTFWVLFRAPETGSNADGGFTRLETGWMQATKVLADLGPVDTAIGSDFIGDPISVGALAAEFAAVPVRSGAAFGDEICAIAWGARPTTTTGGTFRLWRPTSSALASFGVDLVFTGRWY